MPSRDPSSDSGKPGGRLEGRKRLLTAAGLKRPHLWPYLTDVTRTHGCDAVVRQLSGTSPSLAACVGAGSDLCGVRSVAVVAHGSGIGADRLGGMLGPSKGHREDGEECYEQTQAVVQKASQKIQRISPS